MSAELAREIADGLRSLAQMVEDNPHLAEAVDCYSLTAANIPVGHLDSMTAVEAVAAFARAGKASGATVTKAYDSSHGGIELRFNKQVGLHVYAARAEVCERVVTGTELVTKVVPDPSVEVPLVEVTETVEKFEWVCRPLLAETSAGSR